MLMGRYSIPFQNRTIKKHHHSFLIRCFRSLEDSDSPKQTIWTNPIIPIWFVVWNILFFSHILGMSSSQLTQNGWWFEWFGSFFLHIILGIVIPTDEYFPEGSRPPTRYRNFQKGSKPSARQLGLRCRAPSPSGGAAPHRGNDVKHRKKR